MTVQLEKIFFNYILKNKKYYNVVFPYFFRNSEIQFVYKVIQNYMIGGVNIEVPSRKQILEMVNMNDKDGLITKDILKNILQVDLNDFNEDDFILPNLNAWIIKNKLKTGAVDIIDETRKLEDISDYDRTIEVVNKIKLITNNMSSVNFIDDDEDLGSDFDEAENHIQDSSRYKVKSGFKTIDHILGGGWDIQTLNVVMAQTNGGKCHIGDTNINIRYKISKKIEILKVEDLFNITKSNKVVTFCGNNSKFEETNEVKNVEVETPDGWVDVRYIGRTIKYNEWIVNTENKKSLICADKHILYKCSNLDLMNKVCDLNEIYCENLNIGDLIMTKYGPDKIVNIQKTDRLTNMYDLQLDNKSKKQYYTNDILSHNSLWMQNFAVRSANMGYNVLYITLEMSERKVMKRLGSIRLNIPINDYDKLSNDIDFIKKRISNLTKTQEGSDLFDNKIGKIYTKFWAAGTATINDFDNYINRLQEKKNIKIDLIIVDYIALIAPIKGAMSDNLYTKGKQLAEGLRALGVKYLSPVITGVQVAKDAWNSSDITLESVPESKAIAETADTFFAIIRTEEMRRDNKYRFKLLKQRDGDFLKSQISLILNPTYLILDNDQFIDQ